MFWVLYLKKELLEGHFREIYDRFMLIMDTIGLGIFTVVGVNTGIRHGYMDNTFLLVFVGTITGVGGGLLRDYDGRSSTLYLCQAYLCLRFDCGSSSMCVYVQKLGTVAAMVGASAVVFLIRYLAAHYRWNLPRLKRED